MTKAVAQDGHALRYASNALRSDPSFALECVKCSSEAILYISPELRRLFSHVFTS